MHTQRSALTFIFTAAIFAAPPAWALSLAPQEKSDWFKINDTTLQFDGEIVAETERDFFLALTDDIETIIVTSAGGQARPAANIGVEIARRKIDVVVRNFCLSSCANYFFLAGDKKTIEPGSVLGFHGSMMSFDLGAALAEIDKKEQISSNSFTDIYNERNSVIESVSYGRTLEYQISRESRFDIRIYTETGGSVALKSDNYEFPLSESTFLWWPSVKIFDSCYNISNIDDMARPIESELQNYVDRILPGNRIIALGDEYFSRCAEKMIQK